MPAQVTLTTSDPRQIGEYRLIGRLAEGGQGVVYLALTPSGERVALKLLQGAWSADSAARARLVKEVAAARQVARFCTAQVIEARVDGDTPFIVSEFVEGPSLAEFVRTKGPMSGAALDRLAVSTATALVAIHQAQIVHRDLKPANVMLGPDGPRVIDFGIARDLFSEVTVTDNIFGTPAFMAPEQVSGGTLGPAADLFAWAGTMVFAATGRTAFPAPNVTEVMHQILYEEPNLTGVPAPLASILIRCLDKDADRRPTAQQALLRLLGDLGPNRSPAELGETVAQATRLIGPLATPPGSAPRPGFGPRPESASRQGSGQPAVTEQFQPIASYATGGGRTTVEGYRPLDRSSDRLSGLPPRPGRRSRRPSFGKLVLTTVLVAAAGLAAFMIYRSANTQANQGTGANPAVAASTSAGGSRPVAPVLVIPATFAGNWRGQVTQTNTAGTFPATLILPAGSRTGTMNLPSLGCSGTLTVIAPTPTAQELRLTEAITTDPGGRCAPAATITLNPDGQGQLTFSWQDDARANNTARAVLTKI